MFRRRRIGRRTGSAQQEACRITRRQAWPGGERPEQWEASVIESPTRRDNELDALRGIVLRVMAGTYLPTRSTPSAISHSSLFPRRRGSGSSALFLVGSIPHRSCRNGASPLREPLWRRAGTLCGYHRLRPSDGWPLPQSVRQREEEKRWR
jgi:hypothetical protein